MYIICKGPLQILNPLLENKNAVTGTQKGHT